MKNLSINSIDYATVGFAVKKMASAKTVWINRDAYLSAANIAPIVNKENLYNFFHTSFAYGVYGNERFDEIDFDLHDDKTLYAERYGGAGTGDNAGGVRCGNINEFQIKGVGQNCLVGSGKDSWHSYGGLNMVEAICEAVNSVVFDRILPVGIVKCYGLICTGETTAYPPTETGHSEVGLGALLVRDICLRPAHFYRCNFYKDKKHNKTRIYTDVFRTRQVNIQLKNHFNGKSQLIAFLGRFLSNCANQFAFARAFRIMHGAISPSNISFDGKWIDVSTTNFIKGKVAGNNSFFAEPVDILVIVEEFLYNHGKYTLQDFNIAPLINYYWEQFEVYLHLYIAEVFGFTKEMNEAVMHIESFRSLSKSFIDKVFNGNDINSEIQDDDKSYDPAAIFIESIFKQAAVALMRSDDKSDLLDLIKILLPSANNMDIYVFITRLAICSLRKIYFTKIFRGGKVFGSVRTHLRAMKSENICEFIDEYDLASQWLFGYLDTKDECVLLNCKNMEIVFDRSGNFCVHNKKINQKEIFYTSKSLIDYIVTLKNRDLRVNSFFLKENLIFVLDLLEEFDEFRSCKLDDLREIKYGS